MTEVSSTVLSGATDQQVLSMLAAGGSIMHPSPAGGAATAGMVLHLKLKLKVSYIYIPRESSIQSTSNAVYSL